MEPHLYSGSLSALAKRSTKDLGQLSSRLGHEFSDPKLLKLALTHASAHPGSKPNEDNERLEFLGDRVLGLAMAEILLERFPQASEGELARWFNHLVRAETCAAVALSWNLGDFIHMSIGEAASGGRGKKAILADSCEAILGAIISDAGYDVARVVVRRDWEPHFGNLDVAAPDAKSALQEWAQGQGRPLPLYRETAREGPDHAPRFTSEVRVKGFDPECGEGDNKRQAEQAAALAMLLRESVWRPISDD